SRVARLVSRSARGAATSAVTSTDTRATRQVTSTAREVSLRISGVADPAYRADHAARRAELRPYLRDVHVHRAGTGMRRVPPHRGEQLLPRVHPARPVQQVRQQVELGTGQPRQADVQYAGDRAQLAGGGQARAAVVLDVYPEALPGQVHPDQVGDRPLVLHDEDQPSAGRVTHPPMMADGRSARGQHTVRGMYEPHAAGRGYAAARGWVAAWKT